MKKFIIKIEDIDKVVNELKDLMNHCQVFTFEGPLGAGKTTIIRHLLRKCNIHQPITSPTFNYVNVYENIQGQLFYHFDLYRIQSVDEFLEAGFDEFLYLENSWAFIEWPEVIEPLLKKNVCRVVIDFYNNQRKISYTVSL
ncbi:MAG: tRNA (adenosine(37)-N6)-threonylcarbamoyltransferase complex ATPase subunit type 1 TsaE [Candidatus Babeliales bacterium]